MRETMMPPLTEDQRRMAAKNIWLVFSFVHRNKHRIPLGWDVEDFEGELFRALCRAVQRYRPEIGTFSTYLYRYMERQQIRMFRYWHAIKRQRTRTESLGEIRSQSSMPTPHEGPLESAIKSDLVEWLRTLIKDLPGRWQIVMKLRAEGLTLEEIGKKLKITRERARQIEFDSINRIRRTAKMTLIPGSQTHIYPHGRYDFERDIEHGRY